MSPTGSIAMKVKVVQSCLTLCDPMNCSPLGSSVHGDSPGKDTGVCCHFLLQGIFLTQGLNLGLSHCRQILYHLSHQESCGIGNVKYFNSFCSLFFPCGVLIVIIISATKTVRLCSDDWMKDDVQSILSTVLETSVSRACPLHTWPMEFRLLFSQSPQW